MIESLLFVNTVLAGVSVGFMVSQYVKRKEAESAAIELDAAYDLGYRDGYQDAGDDTDVTLRSRLDG